MRKTIIIGIATVALSVALVPAAFAGGNQYGPLDPWMQNLIARNAATGTHGTLDPWMLNLIVRQSEARASSSNLQARVLTPTEVKYYQAENAFYKSHYPG